MFKKLLPLIVVFALLAAYAGYRAVDARASTLAAGPVTSLDSAPAAYLASAQALENDRTLEYTGPGLPASGFEYWQMHAGRMHAVTGPVTSLDSAPAAYLAWARAAGIKSWTNLSTGDIAHQQNYVDPDDCNVPRLRSPGARAAPVPSC